jgi:hypothetical protein
MWTLREAQRFKGAGTWPRVAVPLNIAGLEAWYDASDSATLFDATTGGSQVAANGAVARWEDKSGNARHATQSESGRRPVRKTAVQGGKDMLRFDGTDDSLVLSAITIPASHTVFSVFVRQTASIHSITLGGEGTPGDTRYSAWWFTDNVVYGKSNASFSTHGSDSTSTGAFVLVDTRSATTSVVTRRNSTQIASVTSGNAVTNAASGTWTTIGSIAGASHSGDIAEVIIFNTALSDTDRGVIESYLRTKWGIA